MAIHDEIQHTDRITTRRFQLSDAPTTAKIFYDAVHIGAQHHYTKAQRDVWAFSVPETISWGQRLANQITYVAQLNDQSKEKYDSELVGFMTLDETGYIDLAFVHPDWIGKGFAKALYDQIEATAKDLKLEKLTAHASHLARPFFTRQSWLMVKAQTVERKGVFLDNFVMEKVLA